MASAIISRESIICPVCVDVYKNPRILPCGHSLCFLCINQLISSSLSDEICELFHCPSCRAAVEIPPDIPGRERADYFARNHILHSLVSEYVETGHTEVNVSRDKPSVCVSHNEDIKLYCEDHTVALCSICVCLEHRQCETVVTLEEAMKKLIPAVREVVDKINVVQKRTHVLKENLDSFGVMLHSSFALCQREIDATCEKVIKRALARKVELNAILNKKLEHEESELTKQNISVHELLDDLGYVKSLYEKPPSEISGLIALLNNPSNIDERFESWEKNIRDMYDSAPQAVRMYFKPNNRIEEFLRFTQDFGEVGKTEATKFSAPLKMDLPSASSSIEDIASSTRIENVEDTRKPSTITADGLSLINQHQHCTNSYPVVSFYDETHVVVCFESSTKLMLVNVDDYAVEKEFDLPFEPWDITVYEHFAALTHSDVKTISVFKLPSMSLKRVFTTTRRCNGIDRFNNKFVISCFYDGRIQLLSNKGKLLVETGKIFQSPDCVSVSEGDGCIYVSDTTSHSIHCLNSRLSRKWEFERDLLTYPRGLYARHSGNVIVSCMWTNKIVELDRYGKFIRIISDEKCELLKPRTLSLNTTENRMLVCERGGCIKLFSFE